MEKLKTVTVASSLCGSLSIIAPYWYLLSFLLHGLLSIKAKVSLHDNLWTSSLNPTSCPHSAGWYTIISSIVCAHRDVYLPWTRMCTEVVLGRLLVWTAHTYRPSSVMSTFSILMANSSWLRVIRLTLGSTDHLSSPAYSILDRFSHAVCLTSSPCAQL